MLRKWMMRVETAAKWSLRHVGLFLVVVFAALAASMSIAMVGSDGLGQTVQINTHFRSVVDKSSWLLMIRDVDHNQNIPYVFNLTEGDQNWVAFTYSRNYLILASTLQMYTYDAYANQYKMYRIANFCNLESRGRIVRGKSVFVQAGGSLRPRGHAYTCQVSAYSDAQFAISPINNNQ